MFLKALLNFFFPPHCLVCDQAVEDGLVCEDCLEMVAEIGPPLCSDCGRPVRKNKKCRSCGDIDRVRAWVYYLPPIDLLIHEYKYHQWFSLSKLMGRKLATVLRSDPSFRKIDFIVPIPLHPAKLRKRGFNQSELLARIVGKELGIPVKNVMIRVKNNRPQTGLSETKRKENVKGIFKITGAVKDKKVLLIDDVMTTGSTIEEAAKTIKTAKAKQVLASVVAIVPL